MDLSWPSDVSSSFIRRDGSDADPSASIQDTPEVEGSARPAKPNGLLDIDDSDFEALIEILGTNADGQKGKGQDKQQKEAPDSPQSMHIQQSGQSDAVASSMPSGSNKPVPFSSGSKDDSQHPPSKSSLDRMRPPSSDTRATTQPTARFNSGPSGGATERDPRSAVIVPASSSPGPSRPNRDSAQQESRHPAARPSFTQLKHQLGSSVSDVKDQVADLRSHIQTLKDEVKEFAPHLYQRAFETLDAHPQRRSDEDRRPPGNKRTADTKGKGVSVSCAPPVNGRTPKLELEAISDLSEDEAKNALVNVCQTLHINPLSLTRASTQHRNHYVPVPPSTLPDITRALRLVADMDSLVWRSSSSQTVYNIYDEDNIKAILDRVRLWERTARSRVGRRSEL